MVLGTDEGMALATKLNLAALFIERTGDGFSERATPRFEEITSKRRVYVRPAAHKSIHRRARRPGGNLFFRNH